MNRKSKILKNLLIIIVLFCYSMMNYATSVGANDGSAFITKAEFDSLKSSFQATLDTYNTGIDSKIDSAIAAYLSGLIIANDKPNILYFNIDNTTATGNYIKYVFVEKDYQEQKTQIFNNIIWSLDFLAYNYGVKSLKPYIHINGNSDTASTRNGNNWDFLTRTLQTPKIKHAATDTTYTVQPQMEGFTFDESEDPYVITHWYKNNNLNIVGSSTERGNPNGMRAGDILFPVKGTIFDSAKLNERFEPGNQLQLAYGLMGFSSESGTVSFARNGSYLDSQWNLWWPLHLDVFTTTTELPGFKWQDRGTGYNPVIVLSSCFITESRADEDFNVYLYNECDSIIYAHDENEIEFEIFDDFLADDKRPITSKSVQTVWDTGKALFEMRGSNNGNFTKQQGYGLAFPKIKLKNTYVTQQANGFNNLNQFKNGKLQFSVNGTKKTPAFYGGLPLYTEKGKGGNKPETVTLTIQVDPTIDTSHSGCYIWIKTGEFKNGEVGDTTVWSTADMQSIKTLECTGCTYDSTKKCLFLPKGVKKEITIKDVSVGDTLYLRCAEEGSYYGGEIKYIGDCISHYNG